MIYLNLYKNLRFLLLTILVITSLVSCDRHGLPDPVDPARIKLNPNPKQSFEVTINIKDAPGPFPIATFIASYQVFNCTHMVNVMAGATGQPEYDLPLVYRKIDDYQYKVTVFLDALQDEDYYQQGICRWKFISLYISFKVNKDNDNSLGWGTSGEAILARKETYYYLKKPYPYQRDEYIKDYQTRYDYDAKKIKGHETDYFSITGEVTAGKDVLQKYIKQFLLEQKARWKRLDDIQKSYMEK